MPVEKGMTDYDKAPPPKDTPPSIAEEADNLEALKTIVFQSADFVSKGGNEAQTAFVMDGKITKVVNLNSPDLGTVDLKRAASKIRLTLTGVKRSGWCGGHWARRL